MAEPQRDMIPSRHRHATEDINIRLIGLSALGLAVLLVGGLGLTAWVFNLFNVTPAGQGLRGAPMTAVPPQVPAPRLQISAMRDMQEMRRAESARLQSYAWVDREAGIARIPIDQAIELLVVRGLPSWNEVPVAQPTSRDAVPEEKR